ncbi:MAG: transcriptional repressor [Candidatus Aceula meridiana]|nr:transcriptional repressor [Candidatus Aceula meridiana]
MNETSQILREKNIKVTPQRLSVYMAFNGKGHLSADEVYQKARKKVPAISLGTVYSILENFKINDIISEIKIDFDKSLYELKEGIHHHFLCRKCKKILDVEMPVCNVLKNCAVEGHSIEDFQGYFYGICRDCQKDAK